MLKKWLSCICAAILFLGLGGCEDNSRKVKIGVSIGAGGAARWQKDMAFMQERAKALGADIELRLNLPDSSKTQAEDCLEMLSDGIDVLIITPNNTRKVDDVLMYAKQKNTKVVSYARAVMGGSVDLFVGYDCYKIGQNMGQHLTEKVYHGDIIVLKGDVNDFNTPFLYYGAMKYIKPLIENGKLNMVLDAYVPKWSPAEAKKLVKEAVAAGVKVVTVNNRINDDSIPAVDADPMQQAEVNAKLAIQQVPKDAKVVVLMGPAGNMHSDKRREAWAKYFFDVRKDVKIVGEQIANWNKDEGMRLMEDWIQSNPKIDAIVSMNDNMAAGALEAVKGSGAKSYPLTYGVDGTAEACLKIKAGEMTSTSLQSAFSLAQLSVKMSHELLTGKKVASPQFITAELITKENADKFIAMHKELGNIK